LLLTWTLACNGALRFDEGPMDGGGNDGCTSGNCGWSTEACATPPCPFDCLGETTCSGTCGRGCTASCAAATNCTLAANGEGARLSCVDRASCAFQVTDDATVTCQGSAMCTVYCASSCLLSCNSGATCRLQCGRGAVTTVVGVGMCRDTTP
jgi:hypothetical protein